ncbi:hypothetical protein [Deinococcus sp.]|uniref:hypothetical protein n=1 Tax=Deinococcus sp. TaxID=47478 RepID=UPI0025F7BCFB|nr:hypothetical protein [Deinococcus sp.]
MKRLSLVGAALLVPLVLSACNGDVTPSLGTLNLSGTLVDAPTLLAADDKPWTGGAGQINLRLSEATTDLLSTPLSSGGAFTLNLKDPVDDSKLPAAGFLDGVNGLCDDKAFSVTQSNPAARTVGAQLNVKTASIDAPLVNGTASSTQATTTTPGSLLLQSGGIVYSNAANTVTGSRTCLVSKTSTTVTFNMTLVKGWNSVVVEASGTSAGIQLTLKSSSPLSRWFVAPKPVAQPLSIQSLRGSLSRFLNP